MHINGPNCPSCVVFIAQARDQLLVDFAYKFRGANPDAHISCCARGKAAQEADFAKGTSNAHYGQSPHNYGLSLDFFNLSTSIFRIILRKLLGHAIFDRACYISFLAPMVRRFGRLEWV